MPIKLKTLFTIIFSVITAVAVLLAVAGYYLNKDITRVEQLSQQRYLSYQRADEFRQSSDDLSRMARAYVATGDPTYKQIYNEVIAIRNGEKPRPKEYHTVYWDLVTDFSVRPRGNGKAVALKDMMKELGFSDQEFAYLKAAADNSDQLIAQEVEAIKAIESGDKQKAIALMFNKTYFSEKAKIMTPVNQFIVSLEKRTADEVKEVIGFADALLTIVFLLIAALITVCVVGYLIVAKKVESPVSVLSHNMDLVEKNADLTIETQVNGDDEISAISGNFNRILARVKDILLRCANVVNVAEGSSKHVEEFARGAVRNVAHIAKESDTVAAAVTEMSSVVGEISNNTQQCLESVQAASDGVEEGNRIVSRSRENMEALFTQMSESSSAIDNLSAEFMQVEGVLDVIKSIAEQTNLLALNAAIEAARAGEQGRGFAVVADEVRTLAQRTQTSTGEIETMIGRLTSGMKDAVTSIKGGMGKLEESNQSVQETSVILTNITGNVDNISEMNRMIHVSIKEQSDAVDSVEQSLVSLRDTSETFKDEIATLEKETGNLSFQVNELGGFIRQFRLG